MDSIEPDIKDVCGIQFSIMGPDEIRNRSVVEVTKHDTFDKDVPVIKGLFDPRMGVTDIYHTCKTCGQKNITCPGHFGHIELARPVYHYHFIQTTMKVLKCVCYKLPFITRWLWPINISTYPWHLLFYFLRLGFCI